MNQYEKIRKIGEGAFGKAYLMKEKATSNQVVVKESCLSKLSPKETEDARRETAVLAQMKHPAIVTYHNSFEQSGNLYIVMDFCDGGDLAAKINSQRGRLFSEEVILDWMVQLCLAVKHIHDRNILHRDIKCQNIFLTGNGQVKLGDFGIAKILDSTVQLSHTLIGTPYYFSPELCMGRPYNHKSDIWSLGCVFYELSTLRHAFDGQNLRAVMQRIQNGTPPPISRIYSPDLHLFVSSILKKNPRDRPAINTLLSRAIISKRINKFLTEEQYAAEFSHTVLHGERIMKHLPKNGSAPKAARRPQSAQTRFNGNAHASNRNARPSTGAGARPSSVRQPPAQRPKPPPNEDDAAVAGLPESPGSVDNPKAPVYSHERGNQIPGGNNIPAFRPLPFPSGSRGGDRGNYNNYLQFLQQLDSRRNQAMAPPRAAASAARGPSGQQRPSTAQDNGRIRVVNPAIAKQILPSQTPSQSRNSNAPKRPSSANVAMGRPQPDKPRAAFVRPMRNIPPKNNPPQNKSPLIRQDEMVFDRLQRIRQANARMAKNSPVIAPQSKPYQPVARDSSSAQNEKRSNAPASQPNVENPVSSLTDALRIVQVPGIPASPRVPVSVVPPEAARLTDALNAVTPRGPEKPPEEPSLPISDEELRKRRQVELQKANANPPIIIGNRPYWLPNQNIANELSDISPEMTASKMVSTIDDKQVENKKLPVRKSWNQLQPKVAKDGNENGGTFVITKSRKRPSWMKQSKESNFDTLVSTKEKLATGNFDPIDAKLLKTCSLPSLNDENEAIGSSPASSVSTLEFSVSSSSTTPRTMQVSASYADLNKTLGRSLSTPDLLEIIKTTVAASQAAEEVEEVIDLVDGKSIESTVRPKELAMGASFTPIAEVKMGFEASSSKNTPNVSKRSPRNRSRKGTSSAVEQSSSALSITNEIAKEKESVALPVDDEVDEVSQSMKNLLIVSGKGDFTDVYDTFKPTQTKSITAMLGQLSIQTESRTSSVSSLDGASGSDVPKILEELEKINGPESPPIVKGDESESKLIDLLDSNLLNTKSVITLG